MLQVSGNALQQVKKFKHLGVVFASDGRSTEDIDTQTGKANALLREHHRFVVKQRELSNTAKRSVFKSVLVTTLTCGHDYWVIIEKNTTSGASGRRGIFAESTVQHEGRTEVRLRPGQETSLAPTCSNLRPFRSKGTELKSQRKRCKRNCYRRFGNS